MFPFSASYDSPHRPSPLSSTARNGWDLINKDGDFCTLSQSFTCPHAPGLVNITQTFDLPSIAPSGKYTLTLSAQTNTNKRVVCGQVALNINGPAVADESIAIHDALAAVKDAFASAKVISSNSKPAAFVPEVEAEADGFATEAQMENFAKVMDMLRN